MLKSEVSAVYVPGSSTVFNCTLILNETHRPANSETGPKPKQTASPNLSGRMAAVFTKIL